MKKLILCADVEWEASAALALLIASGQWELSGIVAGNGRVTPEVAAKNAAQIAGYLRSNIPICRGTACAMVADLFPLRKSWEPLPPDWPAYGELPAEIPSGETPAPSEENGVLWLVKTLMRSGEKITILTLGPLTDLGLALRIQPRIREHIEEILIVGGGHRYTDVTACAEFNIRCDPEAAAIVMDCPVPKTLIPLDCAYSVRMERESLLGALAPGTIRELIGRLLDLIYARGGGKVPLPALVGVCALCCPDVLRGKIPYSVDVDCSGGYADGQTVFDTRRIFDDYNCQTAFEADRDQFLHTLRALSEQLCG